MIKNFTREKKIYCGDRYVEVDIIPRTETGERTVKGRRSKKVRETEPKQKNLNDKNSKRYLIQLGNGNFGLGDYHVSLTYSDKNKPKDVKEAERQVSNYFLRVKRYRKKMGLEELKYILITEYQFKKDGEEIIRVHHHIIMNGGIDRDIVEDIWSTRKKKGQETELLGYANVKRLQPNENGIEALCKYVTKNPQGKKRWTSSRNLKRPESRPNDTKFSKRKIESLAKNPNIKQEFEKIYKDYEIVSVEPKYYECTGWHIYIKMWKKKTKKRRE